jgi:hypothetical protein
MTCAIMKSMKFCLFNVALLAAMPGSAFAVDGVVLIDQNKALAGGVTPGDAAGFPVTISQPGSYRLAGNLTVPNGDTTAIVIAADHVTVDLNGFAILGPTDCSGGSPCANRGSATGRGISSAPTVRFNITIRNGTIQGMGAHGIELHGDSHLVEYMHVRSNGLEGIQISASADVAGSIVQHNTVQRNGLRGIFLEKGLATRNVVDVNLGVGITIADGSVTYNVITRNLGFGLQVFETANYIGNVFKDNGTNISGGINQGQNVCGVAPCPGAQF